MLSQLFQQYELILKAGGGTLGYLALLYVIDGQLRGTARVYFRYFAVIASVAAFFVGVSASSRTRPTSSA